MRSARRLSKTRPLRPYALRANRDIRYVRPENKVSTVRQDAELVTTATCLASLLPLPSNSTGKANTDDFYFRSVVPKPTSGLNGSCIHTGSPSVFQSSCISTRAPNSFFASTTMPVSLAIAQVHQLAHERHERVRGVRDDAGEVDGRREPSANSKVTPSCVVLLSISFGAVKTCL